MTISSILRNSLIHELLFGVTLFISNITNRSKIAKSTNTVAQAGVASKNETYKSKPIEMVIQEAVIEATSLGNNR